MTEQAGTETQVPAGDETAGSGSFGWLDFAGLFAAGILVIMLADIFTDGRLISARLWRWRGPGGQEGGPGERGE